jgi:hypothetical protein
MTGTGTRAAALLERQGGGAGGRKKKQGAPAFSEFASFAVRRSEMPGSAGGAQGASHCTVRAVRRPRFFSLLQN